MFKVGQLARLKHISSEKIWLIVGVHECGCVTIRNIKHPWCIDFVEKDQLILIGNNYRSKK